MKLEDRVLRELHRAAADAGRPGIAVPSADLDAVARRTGDRPAAQKAVQRLVRAERAVSVRKDLLVLPDATGLLGVDLTDLVDAIAPQPYLITGGRALERHGLTDQHFFAVSVLVPRRVKQIVYRAQSAKFLLTDPKHIWGWEQGVRPYYALPERAVVDALNHPRYGVTLTQSLDALLLAASRDPGFMDRLLEAVIRYDSPSVARRVGLVIERFFGPDAVEPYRALIGENRAPVLMRPRGAGEGPVDADWRVIVNAVLEPEKASA